MVGGANKWMCLGDFEDVTSKTMDEKWTEKYVSRSFSTLATTNLQSLHHDQSFRWLDALNREW